MKQVATFYLERELFSIPVDVVQEILKSQKITPVPLAPPAVEGLMNLRGQILTVIDLRRRLGLPERDPRITATHILVHHQNEVVSLMADQVGEVIRVDEDTFEPPPESMSGAAKKLLQGAYKLPNRLLLALDITKVLELA